MPGRWQIEASAGSRLLPLLAAEERSRAGARAATWLSGQYRWVPMRVWLGAELERVDPAAAQAELLRRWLGSFGPAKEADIRWWTGWDGARRAGRARRGSARHDRSGRGDRLRARRRPGADIAAGPMGRLAPHFDLTTMGWKERGWYLGTHGPTLFDANGNAGPTVWWNGRVVGGWSQRKDGEIVWELLEDVGADARWPSRRRRRGSPPGSATSASLRASSRRSSARSRADVRPRRGCPRR